MPHSVLRPHHSEPFLLGSPFGGNLPPLTRHPRRSHSASLQLARRMLKQSLGGPGGDAYPPHERDMHNDELRRIRALRGIAELRAKVDGQTAAQAVFGDRASNVL